MDLKVVPSRIRGSIAVIGSKSHTIRGITAALLAEGTSTLVAPLESADTRSTLTAACRLGATVKECPGRWEITGTGGRFSDPGSPLDLGNSGTGLRMLTSVAALQNFPIGFDGDSSLRTRLMSGLLTALEKLGAKVESCGGKCPFRISGPLHGGATEVDGTTSQFLTSLLFALPVLPEDSTIDLEFLHEKPYVGITLAWLDALGIRWNGSEDMLHWRIPGGQKYHPFERVIPADFSTAAFPLVAAAVAGEGVEIRNLDFDDAQGDKLVFALLEEMGAKIRRDGELFVEPTPGRLRGRTLDLNATPDALPVMAVAAALADGETRLVNVPQARVKETDRIAVMTAELTKMGAEIEELPDGMVIRGGSLHGAKVHSHGDHRIGMALAVAGLAARGETVVGEIEAAEVTYPDFVRDFRALGAEFELIPEND